MERISIIVPVFNCAPYLRRCVSSILAQTWQNLELLLIDDGSTDDSGRICDSFADSDPRVRVIHQKNAGVSAARNAGLELATGDYVGFVDADDWIDPKMFETLLGQAALAGDAIIMCDAITVWDGGAREPDTIDLLPHSGYLAKEELTPQLLRLLAGSACRCIYPRELLCRAGIRFPVGIRLSEDRLFNLQAMGESKGIYYLKQGFYFRYMRVGSATMGYQPQLFDTNLRAYELTEAIIHRCWSDAFLPVYARTFLIQGALLAVYQICGKHFHGNRPAAIRQILHHPKLVEAFALAAPQGLREKLLAQKCAPALLLVGYLYQLKHRG